jgi:NDP-sugar pyrophosphorylase family protein
VAVHWREDVTQSGMVEMDGDDRIVRFVEKPKPENVTSHYVSAGFYYLSPGILDYIPENAFSDFAFDVFPRVLQAGEKIHAVKMDAPIIGIDTIESYNRANELANSIISQKEYQ